MGYTSENHRQHVPYISRYKGHVRNVPAEITFDRNSDEWFCDIRRSILGGRVLGGLHPRKVQAE